MEPGLIAELSKFGPLALLAGMALFMMHDEVRALLGAGKRDQVVEGAMGKMVTLFEKNLTYFEALTKQAEKWVELQEAIRDEIKSLHDTQRLILNEMVRGNARGGK